MTIQFIFSLLLTGLIIGALARLAIPGRNDMSILITILVGIAGSFIGGLLAAALNLGSGLAFVVAVLCAAAFVYLISGAAGRRGRRGVI
jgi:uncharacterized membrane protein YeaQ/YmgE (transglycosylase-associated protein family)